MPFEVGGVGTGEAFGVKAADVWARYLWVFRHELCHLCLVCCSLPRLFSE